MSDAEKVRITNEDNEHADLLEVFDADHVEPQECPNCHASANGVIDASGVVLAISCPWCGALFEDDE